MAYEAFTGQRPWITRSPEDISAATCWEDPRCFGRSQQKIQDVIFKALVYNPDDRHENVKIFAEELEKACFGRIRWEKQPLRAHQQNLYQKIKECEEKLHLQSTRC